MPDPLNYIAPADDRRRFPFSVGAFCCFAIWSAAICYYAFVYIPSHAELFADFKIELPGSTKLVVSTVSLLAREYFGMPLLVLSISAGFIVGAIDARRGSTWYAVPRRLRALFWLCVTTMLLLVSHHIIVGAMQTAVTGLITGVSGRR